MPRERRMSLAERLVTLDKAAKNVRILTIDVERQRGEWKVRRWDPYPPKFLRMETMVQRPRIMCFAAKWFGEDEVIYADERGRNGKGRAGTRSMVKQMWDLLNAADVVITFNGDRADIPWMNEEFRYAGLHRPMPFKSLDLYKQSKAARNLPYRSLRYWGQEFGHSNKLEHEGPDLWDLCEAGDPEGWAQMRAYNEQDVRVTEDMWLDELPWLDGRVHMGMLISDGESMRCPNCGSNDLTSQEKPARAYTREYQAFRCNACGSPLRTNFLIGKPQHTRPVR
jgi:hypothetical protein